MSKSLPGKVNKKGSNAGAQKGNTFATKLKDADVRQEAYRQYCQHIAEGWPKEAFFFDHPTHSVCWKTMERYITENPEEFPPILMERAKSARYKHWFKEGQTLMKGGYERGSPVVWQTIMRNMFKDVGWDREQISENNKSHVQRLADAIRGNGDAISEAEDGDSELEQED
jgi:hypothetical protein